MDERDFVEVTKRLELVNKVIATLEPEIRGGAFELFKEYVTAGGTKDALGADKRNADDETPADMAVLERLIKVHGTKKPSKNLHLLAAEWYSEYGCNPFTVETMRQRSESAGITLPERADMTLRAAMEQGKKLFQMDGDGFKPTVPGEMYFKETLKVKRGTKTPPKNEAS